MRMSKLSIIVPAYNEEETLEIFLNEVNKQSVELPLEKTYFFINDGSTDNTLEVLKNLTTKYDNVKYISFSRNFGKEAALIAGLEVSDGDFVTVMDADLQDPPEMLNEMFTKISEGYDVVGTRRVSRVGEPPIRSFFAKTFYKLINKISDTEMVDGVI